MQKLVARCLLAATLLPTHYALAQRKAATTYQELPADLRYADYRWDEKRRQRLPVPADEAGLSAVLLKDFTAIEFYYDPQRRDLRQFVTEHRIVRVNSNDGIEEYNKLAVPVLPGGATVAVRARTISPRGQVVEVQPENMKELKNEGNAGSYRIFALEGVEVGSEVEYYFTRERHAEHFGREILQGAAPEHDVTVEIISPKQLTFEAKVYNADLPVQVDTLDTGKRVLRVHVANLAALHSEPFAEIKARRARVEYKLAYTANRGEVRQFTWNDASTTMHRAVSTLSKDEAKAVTAMLKEAKIPAAGEASERIAAVENYVKLNYNQEAGAGGDLARVAATHNASELGMVRLTTALLRALGIEHELVIGADRSEEPFDASFDSWDYLDHFFLYFPASKQLLAPTRSEMRLGMVPPTWTATPALFVRTVKLGSTEAAMGEVRDVATLPAAANAHDLVVQVHFAPELDKTLVHLQQTFGGYNGAALQTVYPLLPADKQAEVLSQLQKQLVPDGTLSHTTVRNAERGLNIRDKPLVVESDAESAGLLDKAGPRYLFKVGTLIGPQSELYQQEARQYDVELGFEHQYSRKLVIDLPPGYSVRNLNDLNINAQAGADAAAPVYYFHSGYTQQGQQLVVTSTEAYKQIRWPKKDFDAYRNVINAAANFNKVVLVLEKK